MKRFIRGCLILLTPLFTPAQSNSLDCAHAKISDAVVKAGKQIDRWLYPAACRLALDRDRFYESERMQSFYQQYDGPLTCLRLSPIVEYKENSGWDLDHKFHARLRLPKCSQRVKIMFDNLSEEDEVLNERDLDWWRQNPVNDRGRTAALGIEFNPFTNWSLGGDLGLRINKGADLRTRLKAKWYQRWDDVDLRIGQQLFWKSDKGFGELTRFRVGRDFDERHRLESSTALLWSEESRGIDFGQALRWRHKMANGDSWGWRFGLEGHTHPSVEIDEIEPSVFYRVPVYRDWLFFELEPGFEFEAEEAWEAEWFLVFRFDMYFGDCD